MQFHSYSNSPYCKFVRDKWSSDRWDAFQSDLENIGLLPWLGEPADLVNSGISAIRGNYEAAGLNLAATLSVLVWGATAVKIGNKADNVATTAFRGFSGTAKAVGNGVPNSVYNYTRKDGTLVSKYFYNDAGKVNFQIDLRDFNSPYGVHGQNINIPGSLGSGHDGHHIPFMLIPQKYW